jgi:hypothetical protein
MKEIHDILYEHACEKALELISKNENKFCYYKYQDELKWQIIKRYFLIWAIDFYKSLGVEADSIEVLEHVPCFNDELDRYFNNKFYNDFFEFENKNAFFLSGSSIRIDKDIKCGIAKTTMGELAINLPVRKEIWMNKRCHDYIRSLNKSEV